MRGRSAAQRSFICLVDIERRIPRAHPIRRVKALLDEVLTRLDDRLEALYSRGGRGSVPPERLLKARVLMALYSVRSERQFCERLKYDVLFQWFLDMNMEEAEDACFDASVFAKNQERFVGADLAGEFFGEVVRLAQKHGWVSDEHFSVDGTLIDAWASMKSFRPKDEPKDPGDSNGWSDFKGEKRSNATHESKTDPEARLLRKGRGAAAKLCFGMHATMDNRNGLCVVLEVHPSVGKTETTAGLEQLDRLKERGFEPRTLGADKGYHNKEFVEGCRERGVAPHCAQVEKRKVRGLDARTTSKGGYRASLIVRRRIEQIFGWASRPQKAHPAGKMGIGKAISYSEAEHRATLWLGYYYWKREGEKWRAVVDDKARPIVERQDALKTMETAWARMRSCRDAGCWFQADSVGNLAVVTDEKQDEPFLLQ